MVKTVIVKMMNWPVWNEMIAKETGQERAGKMKQEIMVISHGNEQVVTFKEEDEGWVIKLN